MKVIGNTKYLHRSSINGLSSGEYDRVTEALKQVPKSFKLVIIAITTDSIRFTECPEWDNQFEPSVGDSFVVFNNGKTKLNKASKTNPQIYHRRHLFVLDDYQGFDIEEDKARVNQWESLNPDKKRMGRKLWWSEFIADKL